MSAVEWSAVAGFLFGILTGIVLGCWVTYKAMSRTLERHGFDRGRYFCSSDFDTQPGERSES